MQPIVRGFYNSTIEQRGKKKKKLKKIKMKKKIGWQRRGEGRTGLLSARLVARWGRFSSQDLVLGETLSP